MKSLALAQRPRRWPLPPFLRASLALHGAAAAWVVAQPAQWPWALGTVALNHVAIATCGLLPRCGWLGANVTRLPASAASRGAWALTIDDGPDPDVTPRVLDLLERLRLPATFFCIAERAERHPALLRDIVRRGHSVQNHTHSHDLGFSLRGPRRMAREIERAQDVLTALAGTRPTCFRAPAGLRNPLLAPLLHRLDLHLVSWTRRAYDTRVGDAARVRARLADPLAAGDILLLHDGHAARGADGTPVLLDVLPQLAAVAERRGLTAMTLPAAFALA